MKKALSWVFLPLLAGCLTAHEPAVSHWLIEFRPVKTDAPSFREPGVVRVLQPVVRSPYNTECFPVLRADGTVAFDPLNEFADRPSALLRGTTFDALVASGICGGVINLGSKVNEDAAVEVMVKKLALDCRKEGERQAVSEVLVRLTRKDAIVTFAEGAASVDAADGNYGEAFSQAFSKSLLDALGRLK